MAQIDQSTTYARVFYMNDPGLTVSVAISKAGGAFAAAAASVGIFRFVRKEKGEQYDRLDKFSFGRSSED